MQESTAWVCCVTAVAVLLGTVAYQVRLYEQQQDANQSQVLMERERTRSAIWESIKAREGSVIVIPDSYR